LTTSAVVVVILVALLLLGLLILLLGVLLLLSLPIYSAKAVFRYSATAAAETAAATLLRSHIIRGD
jgi:hypothetical protein